MSGQFSGVSQYAVLWGTTAVVLTGAAAWWQHRRAQRNRIPSKWRQVGEISELIMYPLKSGNGVELMEGECTELGLVSTNNAPQELRDLRDRFFMVYNEEDGSFETCRKYASLLLIKVFSAGEGVVIFDAPGVPKLRIDLKYLASTVPENRKLTMWFEEKVEGLDCGDEAAAWLVRYLKKDVPLRLACHIPERIPRRNLCSPPFDIFGKYYKRLRSNYAGAFSDMASFMLMSEASLTDLKKKLPPHLQNIPPKQFRPNIVVRGSNPYEEDQWDWVKIGNDIVLCGFKPCTRCTVTTMDPDTGVREPKLEPLKTMNTYRQLTNPEAKKLDGDAPVMGLYLGLHVGGLVKIGDPVYIGDE